MSSIDEIMTKTLEHIRLNFNEHLILKLNDGSTSFSFDSDNNSVENNVTLKSLGFTTSKLTGQKNNILYIIKVRPTPEIEKQRETERLREMEIEKQREIEKQLETAKLVKDALVRILGP